MTAPAPAFAPVTVINTAVMLGALVPTLAGLFMFAMQVVPAVNVALAVQNAEVEPEIPTAQFVDVVIVVWTLAEAPKEMNCEGTLVVLVVVRPLVLRVTLPVSTCHHTRPPPAFCASVMASMIPASPLVTGSPNPWAFEKVAVTVAHKSEAAVPKPGGHAPTETELGVTVSCTEPVPTTIGVFVLNSTQNVELHGMV